MGSALDVDSSRGWHPRSHGAVRLRSRSEGSVSGRKLRLAEILRRSGACARRAGIERTHYDPMDRSTRTKKETRKHCAAQTAKLTRRSEMKIKVTSVYVDDQEKALRFYTEVLGFVKKTDFSQGPYRWLTVASAEEPDGTELQLAPSSNPAPKAYQHTIFQKRQSAVNLESL